MFELLIYSTDDLYLDMNTIWIHSKFICDLGNNNMDFKLENYMYDFEYEISLIKLNTRIKFFTKLNSIVVNKYFV